MARTHKKVRYSPKGKRADLTPTSAAEGVEDALKILEGRWKLVILFHLFGGKVLALFGTRTGDPGSVSEDAHPAASPDGSRWNCPAHPPPAGSAQSRVLSYNVGTSVVPGARCPAEMGGAARQDAWRYRLSEDAAEQGSHYSVLFHEEGRQNRSRGISGLVATYQPSRRISNLPWQSKRRGSGKVQVKAN